MLSSSGVSGGVFVLVVGHDIDGRPVSYDEARRVFWVGGVTVDLPRFVRYARKGMVLWTSDATRSWFEEWERTCAAYEAGAKTAEAQATPAEQAEWRRRVDESLSGYEGSADLRRERAADAEFLRARSIGSEGEREVSAVLRRMSSEAGWHILDNLLLRQGKSTAQFDHVIIDRRGIVLVETKTRRATIMGRESDSHWTACYGKGSNKRFQNPLMQNMYHESILLNALAGPNHRWSPDYVTSLVVFVGARLDRLELRKDTRRNVIEVGELPGWCRSRMGAQPSALPLSEQQGAALAEWLRRADRSSDSEVRLLHEAYRRGKRR
jgi:hypothetical protein